VWTGCDQHQAEDWLRYESLLNVVLEPSPASLLCAYDAASLSPDILAGARSGHPAVCEGGQTTASPAYRSFFSTSPPPS
jgi:hypothetical protein